MVLERTHSTVSLCLETFDLFGAVHISKAIGEQLNGQILAECHDMLTDISTISCHKYEVSVITVLYCPLHTLHP